MRILFVPMTVLAVMIAGCGHVSSPPQDQESPKAMEDGDTMEKNNVDAMKMEKQEEDTGAAMEKEEKEDDSGEAEDLRVDVNAKATIASYGEYRDGVIGNGQSAVVFFHADWCPKCKTNHEKLISWFPSVDFVNTYRVNYDSATELKEQLGVVQQDTFVRIDAQGNVQKRVSFPTEAALRDLLAMGQ